MANVSTDVAMVKVSKEEVAMVNTNSSSVTVNSNKEANMVKINIESINSASRKELQIMAKKAGIKANSKSEVIRAELLKLVSNTEVNEAKNEPENGSNNNFKSISKTVAILMARQIINSSYVKKGGENAGFKTIKPKAVSRIILVSCFIEANLKGYELAGGKELDKLFRNSSVELNNRTAKLSESVKKEFDKTCDIKIADGTELLTRFGYLNKINRDGQAYELFLTDRLVKLANTSINN